jgi:uncharacterized protein (TIGR02597 family)
MSSRTFLPLILAAAASPIALGADPIFTDPVGFVKLGNMSAGDPVDPGLPEGPKIPAVAPNTDVWISVPLENTLMFSGTVASVDAGAGTITVNGTPGWMEDQWVSISEPNVAIIGSGAENGLRGLIIDNDDSGSLTITQTSPGSLSNVVDGDVIRIRRAWTLSSFFANTDVYSGCQVLTFDETLGGVDHTSGPNESFTYFFGNWGNGSSQPSNNRVLYPGEMLIFRTAGTAVNNLTLFGDVALAAQRVEIMKDSPGTAEDLELAMASPAPKFVGQLGIPAENGDLLLFTNNSESGVRDKTSGPANSLTYFFGQWGDGNSNNVTNTFVVNPGTAFKLRRSAASTATPVEWTVPAP